MYAGFTVYLNVLLECLYVYVVLDFHDDFDEFIDRDSDVAAATSSTSHNITDWEVGGAYLLFAYVMSSALLVTS